MAIRRSCDACGGSVDVVERGQILKRDYCATCVDAVDEYLMALDRAHTAAAELFAKARDEAAAHSGVKDLPV